MNKSRTIDPGEAYAIIAEFSAKPGMEAELRTTTLPLVAQARGAPNVLSFFLHEDRERPEHFIFYEVLRQPGRFRRAHREAAPAGMVARLPELAAGDVRVVRAALLGARAMSLGGGEA